MDGIWLDMNEVCNFCEGYCWDAQIPDNRLLHQLPYMPTGRSLEHASLPLDGVHEGGMKELDVHNLFGTM